MRLTKKQKLTSLRSAAVNSSRRKTCSKCDERKPLNEFYRDPACKDGHRPDCKKCSNKHRASWAKARYVSKTGRQNDVSLEGKARREAIRTARNQRREVRAQLQEQGLRKCRKCSEIKPLGEFYRHPKGAGGYRTVCKKCEKKYLAQREAARRESTARL